MPENINFNIETFFVFSFFFLALDGGIEVARVTPSTIQTHR